ncbi:MULTISPECIES: hypothetical protein [Halorussus]|uniref:DUF7553 family protein n=1 Tax=Halorussus TaxID=1070314 RepID=UPI000E212CA2|nr:MULTISPECIES: hypothetical protein [Halorussus]NHN61447.1 hypothetical protein [Halorussus sp. JP-T4]
MSDDRTHLRTAADELDELAGTVSNEDAADRLDGLADRLTSMADADRGPDHGSLDRLTHNLREVREDLDDEAAETVDAALGRVREYRETVEGV